MGLRAVPPPLPWCHWKARAPWSAQGQRAELPTPVAAGVTILLAIVGACQRTCERGSAAVTASRQPPSFPFIRSKPLCSGLALEISEAQVHGTMATYSAGAGGAAAAAAGRSSAVVVLCAAATAGTALLLLPSVRSCMPDPVQDLAEDVACITQGVALTQVRAAAAPPAWQRPFRH